MTRYKIARSSSILVVVTAVLVFLAQSAIAGYYEYDYFYTTNRLSREHRLAGDVDDWIERGNSTVTASPVFADGIRLAAWANEYEMDETFEFGIASAVYFFEIPKGAQFVEIKVRYKGEAHEGYLEEYDKVAGRVWIRNTEKEREYQYEEGNTDTLYGDTFVLRANRRSETIKIPAVNHVDDGTLELHIVAQAGELIDVNYIDIEANLRQPEVRVVDRYVREYEWNPWYNYTYCYFYAGPHYYDTNYGYYLRWSYPLYDRHYIIVRQNYRRYLDVYRRRHGVVVYRYYRPVKTVGIRAYDRDRARSRRRLTKWTDRYETVRHEYSRSLYTKKLRDRSELENTRTRIRNAIEKHRQEPVLVDREIQSRRINLKRRRDTADKTDESIRSSMKTRTSTRYQRSDDRERTERIKQIRTQPQEDRSRIRIRSQKTEPRKQRKVEVKRKRTETKRTTDRKKKSDDDDDDDEKEEKKRSERREARKKRR